MSVIFSEGILENIRKFVWIAIIFAVAVPVFTFLRDVYLASTYGALEIPHDIKKQWESISLLVLGLQNVAAALWLWYEASKNKSGSVVWSLFGLVFGINGVRVIDIFNIVVYSYRQFKREARK